MAAEEQAYYTVKRYGTNDFIRKRLSLNTPAEITAEITKLREQLNLYDDDLQQIPITEEEYFTTLEYLQNQINILENRLAQIVPRSQLDKRERQKQMRGLGMEGGMIIKQKLKGFEISNDGYGIEIDKLFTQITKQTLVDIMKQLGETQNEFALMKKSKLVLTNYFMSKYASKTHTGSKVVADNRRKKKEKYDSPEEKRKVEFMKERNKKLIKDRFEASKPRPPPVRRKSVGEKPVSVKPVRPAPVRRPDRFV